MPALFDTLVEVLAPHFCPTAAAMCPKIPSVSEWAQTALGFTADPKQKLVLDHDAHRLVLCCARQWGKTTIAAIKALHTAIFEPGTEIVVVSRSLQQAGLLITKICQAAHRLGYKRRRIEGCPHSMQLPNGSRIFAIAHAENSGRGYTAHIVIVDEAALVEDDVIASAAPSLARTNGKLWLLSTPSGQTGLFYHVWHDRECRDWFHVKATIEDCPDVDDAFIAEQRSLFPHNFRQEFYCEFTPSRGRLLTRESVEAMIDPTITAFPFQPLSGRLR